MNLQILLQPMQKLAIAIKLMTGEQDTLTDTFVIKTYISKYSLVVFQLKFYKYRMYSGCFSFKG